MYEMCKKCKHSASRLTEFPCSECSTVLNGPDDMFLQKEEPQVSELPDQAIKADAGKPPLHLVPPEIVRDIARVREFGNKKYGESESWRRVVPERYIDAAYRHMIAFAENPVSIDEESGMPHLWHLACNVAFLCEMYKAPLPQPPKEDADA